MKATMSGFDLRAVAQELDVFCWSLCQEGIHATLRADCASH